MDAIGTLWMIDFATAEMGHNLQDLAKNRRMDRVVWRRHGEGGKLFSAERWPLAAGHVHRHRSGGGRSSMECICLTPPAGAEVAEWSSGKAAVLPPLAA